MCYGLGSRRAFFFPRLFLGAAAFFGGGAAAMNLKLTCSPTASAIRRNPAMECPQYAPSSMRATADCDDPISVAKPICVRP